MMILFLIFTLLIPTTFSGNKLNFFQILKYFNCLGTLTPIGTNPITHTKSNKGEFADYTFTFSPENVIPEGGTIEVIFPS